MNGERQFGPYRLIRQIAVGGMAEIHLAKTRGIAGFEKYVALKMIHPNFSSDDQFIEMLIDEAKISVQLQHANIAQTFDLGCVGDRYYITMEYVDGADLYKLLKQASEKNIVMPVDVAAFVAKEIANGLDYAHRKRDEYGRAMGIVHRDISPQNVLISHSGEVKLVDFGIAKATMKARQTAVGVIKGKYYYMSPEQAWGDPVDLRTDIFSAGILLYESLTGQMLYLEEDLHRLLQMVRSANIARPTSLRRDIPPQLEHIVMNALRKERDDRYQSAADLSTDLERFLHTYSPVFTPAKIAEYFHSVLEDQAPLPAIAVQQPQDDNEPSMVTMRLDTSELLRERDEFSDENSVIFQIDELRKDAEVGQAKPAKPPRSSRDSTRKLPSHQHARPREEVMDNIEEQTMISAPPGFGGAEDRGAGDEDATFNLPHTPRVSPSDFPEDGDFEPTLVGTQFDQTAGPDSQTADPASVGLAGGEVDEDGPTLRRDRPQELDSLLARHGANRKPPPPPPRKAGTKKRGPVHPALGAKNPQPAVSALNPPRRSRKTPPNVPDKGGPSVLSALVGPSDAIAPVQRDRPQPTPPSVPQQAAPGAGPHHPAPGSGPHHPAPGSGPHHPAPGSGPHHPAPGSGPHHPAPGSGPHPMAGG
ncbi:MAG: protein kinase, partial [Proteobacteria bacterium]|nr:protein kinase [Pseudomonadota bacterium]